MVHVTGTCMFYAIIISGSYRVFKYEALCLIERFNIYHIPIRNN